MYEKLKVYVKWWKTWRSLPVREWVKGATLYREGKFSAAEQWYGRGLARFPHHPAAHTARLDYAYCLFKSGKLNDAEEQLRRTISQNPTSREAHLRLARLQSWCGCSLEAAWTVRRALQHVPADADLIATYLMAVVENGGPGYLVREASNMAAKLLTEPETHLRLETALIHLALFRGRKSDSLQRLREISSQPKAPFDAVVLLASQLLDQGNIANARHHMRRALSVAPNHPRVLSLLAMSYLKPGIFHNPHFAVQLATESCKSTQWRSPRDMHVLAEAYRANDDKMAALLIASRAKEVGSRLLGEYRDVKILDRLIESLSSGTQA